jgi:hypothetical protein
MDGWSWREIAKADKARGSGGEGRPRMLGWQDGDVIAQRRGDAIRRKAGAGPEL